MECHEISVWCVLLSADSGRVCANKKDAVSQVVIRQRGLHFQACPSVAGLRLPAGSWRFRLDEKDALGALAPDRFPISRREIALSDIGNLATELVLQQTANAQTLPFAYLNFVRKMAEGQE